MDIVEKYYCALLICKKKKMYKDALRARDNFIARKSLDPWEYIS